MISLKSTVFVILLVSLITASAPAMQSQTDWDELGPNVMIDDEARSIIEVFDKEFGEYVLLTKYSYSCSLNDDSKIRVFAQQPSWGHGLV